MVEARANSSQPVQRIISLLERCEATGQRADRVFEDWLNLTEAYLDMLPNHLTSIAKTGRPADDPPEVSELWARLRKTYNPESRLNTPGWWKGKKTAGYFELFSMAANILIDHAHPIQEWAGDLGAIEGPDLVGQIYMMYGGPNQGTGQYFTPWNVALTMAMMTNPGESEVHARLKEAAKLQTDDPLADALRQATLMASIVVPPEESFSYFQERVLPVLAPLARPITISDPALGSGVMLLAAAAQYPQWAINWGLVRFYGQDIDYICCQMARINFKLYGLTPGAYIKSLAELTESDIKRLIPPASQPVYLEAKQASRNGNNGRVKELAQEFRQSVDQYQQANMFDF